MRFARAFTTLNWLTGTNDGKKVGTYEYDSLENLGFESNADVTKKQ